MVTANTRTILELDFELSQVIKINKHANNLLYSYFVFRCMFMGSLVFKLQTASWSWVGDHKLKGKYWRNFGLFLGYLSSIYEPATTFWLVSIFYLNDLRYLWEHQSARTKSFLVWFWLLGL